MADLVTTTSGRIHGRHHEFGSVFHNVPYATLGAGRFAAPTPHPGWTDIRDATTPGPTAPQPARDFGALDMSAYFAPGWQRGDDYLTVNIWAPADAAGRPVMVFVHGGGFVAGSNRAPLYDGTAFARDGVVLVTVNYRLGIPGFLHLPEAPDNRGLLDVRAALRWIQHNIAGFGGDPGKVTVFGQSAGATIVGGLLTERGLFRRAIMQSGSGTGAFTPEQADIVTTAVGRELDLKPTAETLADIPDERLITVNLTGLDLRTPTDHDPLGGLTPFSLVTDRQPATLVAERGSEADLLIGSNVDEASLYLLGARATDRDVHDTAAKFHPDPDNAVRSYRARYPSATAAELRTLILSDGLFRTGTREMAAAHAKTGRTYSYEFAWRAPALGASHVMELPFVFDRLSLPALRGLFGNADPPAELATRIHRAWIDFATTGDPGWPAYEPGGHVERLL